MEFVNDKYLNLFSSDLSGGLSVLLYTAQWVLINYALNCPTEAYQFCFYTARRRLFCFVLNYSVEARIAIPKRRNFYHM